MERAALLDALAGQLDELQSLVNWVLAFAFTATVLAIQGDDPISVLNLSLTRIQAFFVLAAVYIAACTAALVHLRRLTTLMASLPSEDIATGFDKLATHPWLFNPFIVDQKNLHPASQGTLALTALACVFWLCLASLYALLPREAMQAPLAIMIEQGFWNGATWAQIGFVLACMAPLGLFVVIGDLALAIILRMINDAAGRAPSAHPEFKAQLEQYAVASKKAADYGIAAGGLVWLAVVLMTFGISTG